jgi:sulfatase modifying factor 1
MRFGYYLGKLLISTALIGLSARAENPTACGISLESSDRAVVRWSAIPGTFYVLDSATSVTGAWQQVSLLRAAGESLSFGLTAETGTRFFRVHTGSSVPANPDPERLVWISPGVFTMGSPTNEVDRWEHEGPQTVVNLTKGFWMRKLEVSQREYEAITGNNPAAFLGDIDRPVERTSWTDATAFCATFTELERAGGRLPTGYVYRLPTEAEWEYCCRAGTTNRFFFGDDPDYTGLAPYAWNRLNSYYLQEPPGVSMPLGGVIFYTTHAVGTKSPNPWGLYDIQGNVWEWVQDYYSWRFPGGEVTDPQGPPSGSERVARGGAWNSFPKWCRSAMRLEWADEQAYFAGFRMVLAPK